MSTVYLAVQLSVGREVALKVMSPVLNADPVFSKRFQREANIVGQLSHPNIVSIYDIGCHNSLNYIAMDYLPGGTVHERMHSGMSSLEVLRVIREISQALAVAHTKGYVHRDIKPENILFREDGSAVLTDFGVAKALSTAAKVTNAGTVVGTPHYMSPEQSRGLPIDGRSDIYSLGIVFYEMLTGVVPYQADAAVAIAIKHLTAPVPTLPGHYAVYQSLINRLLAKSASDRFQNATDIVAAVNAVEDTMMGYSGRKTPLTDASEMSVMALFKALLLTSLAALRIKLAQLGRFLVSWRWTPKQGLFRHPAIQVTKVQNLFDSGAEQRTTVISKRIQQAAHYQQVSARKLGLVTRVAGFLLAFSVVWAALCVGLVRFDVPTDRYLPAMVSNAVQATASAINDYRDSVAALAVNSADSVAAASSSLPNREAATVSDAARSGSELEPPSSEPIEAPPLRSLTVAAEPKDATIRVLNIREKYSDGIQLESGRYHIEVARAGFSTVRDWVRLDNKDLRLSYQLDPLHLPGDTFTDPLGQGDDGPELVVIAPGEFTMGRQGEARSSPERDLQISSTFAVSKYEITFADYQKFTLAQGLELPDDRRWGQGSRPVINVSWHDAVAYTQWLSEQTGHRYRLPSEAEWEYVARAGTSTDHWWEEQDPSGKANCKRGCDSDYTGLFSSKTAPVGSFPANAFELHDTAGNVAEWVLDCYQNHYVGAPRDGGAITVEECSSHPVRGGAANDPYSSLTSYAREEYAADRGSAMIGFRVLREFDY